MKRVHIIPCVFSICMLLILFSNSQVLAQQYARANQFKGFIDLYDPKRPENELPSRLSLKIKAEIEAQTQKNSDFKNAGGDSFKTVEPSLSFAFSYPPTENLTAYLTLETSALFYDDPREEKEDEAQVELEEVYLQYKNTGGDILVTLGRQERKDKRTWLFDEELDALSFRYFLPRTSLDFSVSREKILIGASEKKKSIFYLLSGTFQLREKETATLFWLQKDENKASGELLNYYGLNYNGDLKSNLFIWFQLAQIWGRDSKGKIVGAGIDAGFTLKTGLPLKHSFTLGYALGSGGEEKDSVDTNFRQTGAQDNKAKVNGITGVKYYGEVFDPELSNISIVSISSGIRPTKRSSIEFLYHSYRQKKASNNLRDSEIDADPNGIDKFLGREIDFAAALKYSKKTKVSFTAGYFFPGTAFGEKAPQASFFEAKAEFKL